MPLYRALFCSATFFDYPLPFNKLNPDNMLGRDIDLLTQPLFGCGDTNTDKTKEKKKAGGDKYW